METVAITVAFLGFIAFREWTNYKHVKDLETKLVAKNASDYLTWTANERNEKPRTAETTTDTEHFVDISGMNFDDFSRIKRGE